MKTVMDLGEFRRAVGSNIFTISFYKRDPRTKRPVGPLRTMTARFGVTAHLKGGELAYVPKEKNLMCVYDMTGNPDDPKSTPGYKMINLEGLVELRWKGRTWPWDSEAQKFFA